MDPENTSPWSSVAEAAGATGGPHREGIRIREQLLEQVKRMGFCLMGVADPAQFEGHPRVSRSPEGDEYAPHPREIWSGCRSVVVIGLHCHGEVHDALVRFESSRALFYMEIIAHRLYRVRQWLQEEGWEAHLTEEISIKRAAVLAGLGSVGRNTLVAHPEYGSNLRFGVLLTDMDLSPDKPNDPFTAAERCADCRLCEEICPSGAIADYQVDFSRCVIPAAEGWLSDDEQDILGARRIQERGEYLEVECNLCQKVCPLNGDR